MESNQCDNQPNSRLRSRNKRNNHNGLNNVKTKITKMEPVAKRKVTELLRVKKKRVSCGNVNRKEYVCTVCNTVFKSTKDFKIHEEHGCNNHQSNEMLVDLTISDDEVEIQWESKPRLILTRLTPEILNQYIRNVPSREESNSGPESPEVEIPKTFKSTSLQESGIATENCTPETLNTHSTSNEGFVEPALIPKTPISQPQLRRSSRTSTAVAEECSTSKLIQPVSSDIVSTFSNGDALPTMESSDINLSKHSRGKIQSPSSTIPSQPRRVREKTMPFTSKTIEMNPETLAVNSDSDKRSQLTNSSSIVRRKMQVNKIRIGSALSNKLSTKSYKCQVCQDGFSTRKDLLSHIVIHPDIKETRFSCSLCENTYHRKQSLDIHILNQHTSLRPYSCPKMCGSSFAIRHYLSKHIKNCNAKKPVSYVNDKPKESECFPDQRQSENGAPNVDIEMRCPLCNRVCSSHLALVNHMLRHKAQPVQENEEDQHQNNSNAVLPVNGIGIQEAFVCLICNKSFSTRQRLGVHKSKHKMVTQTQLPRSDAIVNSSVKTIDESSSKEYIRGPHRKRKSFMGIFKCSSCDYSTKYFGSLNKHERQVHNRVTVTKNTISLPNFIYCQFCSYATRYKCNMDSHQKRKHGSRLKNSFSCKQCSFSTATVLDWKNHQFQAHNVRPISTCNKCNFVFASYYELKCHRMKHLRENTTCDANLQTLSPAIPAPTEEVKDAKGGDDDCVILDERKTLHVCKLCGKMYARKHFLENHIQCVHANNKLSLATTNENEQGSLPANQIIPTTVKKEKRVLTENQCRLCLVECVSASALEKHYQRHRVL